MAAEDRMSIEAPNVEGTQMDARHARYGNNNILERARLCSGLRGVETTAMHDRCTVYQFNFFKPQPDRLILPTC
jgi:hypothetical protein